jgi:tetratricopeptide (TPR) repeat protein
VIDCFRAGKRNPPVMFGVDESVLALVYMARVLWALGQPEEAAAAADEAMTLSRNGMNSVSVAVAYYGLMFTTLQIRRAQDTEALVAEATAHADEHGLPLFQNWFAFLGAVLRLKQGRDAEALQQMEAALPAADGRLSRQFRPFYLGCIAEAYMLLGAGEQALANIGDALETAETTGEKQSLATLHRIKGEILDKLGRSSEAEAEFRRAISVAGKQKAKVEELRAALSMLKAGCDPVFARDKLAQVYATFTEGLNLPDLVASREALEGDL